MTRRVNQIVRELRQVETGSRSFDQRFAAVSSALAAEVFDSALQTSRGLEALATQAGSLQRNLSQRSAPPGPGDEARALANKLLEPWLITAEDMPRRLAIRSLNAGAAQPLDPARETAVERQAPNRTHFNPMKEAEFDRLTTELWRRDDFDAEAVIEALRGAREDVALTTD